MGGGGGGGGGALTPVFRRCGWEFGLGYEKGGLSLIQELSEGGGGGGGAVGGGLPCETVQWSPSLCV